MIMADEISTNLMAGESSTNSMANEPTAKPKTDETTAKTMADEVTAKTMADEITAKTTTEDANTTTRVNENENNEIKEGPPPKSKPYKIKKRTVEPQAREEVLSTFRMNKLLMRVMFVGYIFYFGYKWLYKSPQSDQSVTERLIDYKNYLFTAPEIFPDKIPNRQLTIVYCSTCKFTKSVEKVAKSISTNLSDLEDFQVFLLPYKNAPIYVYMSWMYTLVQIGIVIMLIYMAEVLQFIEQTIGLRLPVIIAKGLMFLSEKRIMIMIGIYMSGGMVKNLLLDVNVYDAYYGNEQIWSFAEMNVPTAGRLTYLVEKIEGIAVF